MSKYPKYQEVIDDWSSVVNLPSPHVPSKFLFEDNPELAGVLNSSDITLERISKLSMNTFDCIGGDVIWLTSEEIIWMLPVLLSHGVASEESIFARSVIQGLQESVPKLQAWPAIKKSVLPKTLIWLNDRAQECCRLGWEDERRIKKHGDICRKLLYSESRET